MTETLRKLFARPTPMEKAARELEQLAHMHLEVTATISWANQRLAYNRERAEFLKDYLKEGAVK